MIAIIILFSLLFLIDLYYWNKACIVANTTRHAMFINRPIISLDEWQRLFTDKGCPQENIINICSVIASLLQCHVVQVLPTDTFSNELKLDIKQRFCGYICLGRFLSEDDVLDNCIETICDLNSLYQNRVRTFILQRQMKYDFSIIQFIIILSSD